MGGRKLRYNRLYRAMYEEEKEFVAHSYCQILLHDKWLGGVGFLWSSQNLLQKCPLIRLNKFSNFQINKLQWS